jgi:hypothetical protein
MRSLDGNTVWRGLDNKFAQAGDHPSKIAKGGTASVRMTQRVGQPARSLFS